MKHIIFFTSILCLLIFPTKGISQDLDGAVKPGHLIYFGAKAGGGLSNLSQPGTTMKGSVGAFARYQAWPFLEIEVDLLYDVFGGGRGDFQRGEGLVPPNNLPADQLFSVGYLNRRVFFHTSKAQLSARLSIPELKSGTIQPKLIVGASSAHIMRARENRNAHYVFGDGTRILLSDTWEEVSRDYEYVNFAVHLGIALDFDLPNKQVFSVEFVFDQGLTELSNIQLGQTENIEKLWSQQIGINFSYTFFNQRINRK